MTIDTQLNTTWLLQNSVRTNDNHSAHLQNDYSISQERKDNTRELLKQRESEGFNGEFYLTLDSYEEASKYLGGFLCNAETMSSTTSKLSFKENVQDSYLSSATIEKMQDYSQINTHKSSIKTFGGYTMDENGFMGADFLSAANLPSHYKIHSNTLQAFHDYYTTPLKRGDNDYQAEFHSLDLIAGISYASNELNKIFQGSSKDFYSKEEIVQRLKENEYVFLDSAYETPLMRDYQNQKGEFSMEGILLMFAFNSDAFAKAQSPFTQLSEYGKFQRGMPSSYSPNNDNQSSIPKNKTPEELKKEMQDSLMEYYLKAIECDKNVEKQKGLLKEVNEFVNATIRDSLKSF